MEETVKPEMRRGLVGLCCTSRDKESAQRWM